MGLRASAPGQGSVSPVATLVPAGARAGAGLARIRALPHLPPSEEVQAGPRPRLGDWGQVQSLF